MSDTVAVCCFIVHIFMHMAVAAAVVAM